MDDSATDGGPAAMVCRLRQATNDCDLPGLVACFAPGYRNLTPAHPGARFHRPGAGAPELGKDATAAVHGQVGSGGSQ